MIRIRRLLVALAVLLALPGHGLTADAPDPRTTARQAVEAAETRDWAQARLLSDKTGDPLLEKFVAWLEYQDSRTVAGFGPISRFLSANPDWPRARVLRRAAERAILPLDEPHAIADWFAAHPPLTGRGALAHLAALDRLGRVGERAGTVRQYWVSLDFAPEDEAAFVGAHGRFLKGADHEARLDRLLQADDWGAATRMLGRVATDIAALARARIALMRGEPGVDGAIARVPPMLRDAPELWFERLRWRRRKDFDAGAREILYAAPATLPGPERWAFEGRVLARRALAEGHYSEAAQLAARHRLSEGAAFAEGEFLAGWVRLSFLRESEAAYRHFETLYNGVSYPISRARGAYWAGRAAALRGDDADAQAWYARAGEHATTFYGQRALEALGRPLDRFGFAVPDDPAVRAAFLDRELVRLVLALHRIGANDHLRPFLLHLADLAESLDERLLVAQLAREVERPREAIHAMKRAHQLDHAVAATGYPVRALPSRTDEDAPEDALVLALIRQESGFDPEAVSGASARGMMQLLPATAKLVAGREGIGYEHGRLTGDPDYNIRLGTAYLSGLLARFEGAPALALAAYNAGPNRVDRWLRENGDPRAGGIDLVDWIEAIPYHETRNYVQRVLEAVPVYRYLLSEGQLAQAAPRPLLRPGDQP